MAKCLEKILNYCTSAERNKAIVAIQNFDKTICIQSADPIVNLFYQFASSMADFLANEYAISQTKEYKLLDVASQILDCLVQFNDEKPYQISQLNSSQTCCTWYMVHVDN